jgi:hypothetical protein
MYKLTYEQIQNIEGNATKKLLKYINKYTEDANFFNNVDFYYPDFGEQKNIIAFNVWISIDYITKDGKTFIEHFLEEMPKSLTNLEKEVLIERNKSHISLFEIIDFEEEFLYVKDLLQNQTQMLWEPELINVLNSGDFIFARIGKVLDSMSFIGDISYLPRSMKPTFLEEVFLDFNHIRLTSPSLTMKEYLKQHSINLYKIYTDCMYEAIEIDEDITSIVYDELDEFEGYLQLKSSRSMIKKHISNLIDLFEYYLMDEDMTLYDLDQLDFEYFFNEAIIDGFISTQEDLNSYISTLKKYIGFLKNITCDYKEAYEEILNISNNRFNYLSQLKYVELPFKINRKISTGVSCILNEDAISLIMDYDKFILYIIDKPLEVTGKNKYIKRKHLLEINSLFDLEEPLEKKAPNQEDFPLIHMFYKFSLNLGLIVLNGNYLTITKKGSNFLRLKDEEKYSLFFEYIWSSEFIGFISRLKSQMNIDKFKKDFMKLLASFKEDTNYKINMILPLFSSFPDFFFSYYRYLEYLGLIRCSLYPNYNIRLTPFGKIVLTLFEDKNNRDYKCNIINLELFRKSR